MAVATAQTVELGVADPTAVKGAGIVSVVGQSVVGKIISTPWMPGANHELTQGYGQTQNTYPTDHGTIHWHSGVDIDCPPLTVVVMPAGLTATAVYLDNPDGYGTALILRMFTQSYAGHAGGTAQVRNADIYLGHLAARTVRNGQTVRGGDHLAKTDTTGRATGPHLHFEVRPPDGRYGTDVDPSQWLLQGNAALQGLSIPDPFAGIGDAITKAEQDFVRTLVGLGQTALGGTLMLAGGAAIGFGLRGRSGQQAIRSTRRTAASLNRRRVTARPVPAVGRPRTSAERSRLRPTLQREVGPAPTATPPQLGAGRPRVRMSVEEYQTSMSGVSLQRQRQLAAQGIRARPGSAPRARMAS